MITVHTVAELREHVRTARQAGKRIGFVPTMGNLHAGHISLIDSANSETDYVVSSVFVNPLQFNDQSDLQRYPRTLPQDQEKLSAADCDLLFAPDVDEMYPNGQAEQSIVHVPVVSKGLCGGSRPGHFDGVSTVVTKLFNQVLPDAAFFGEKDFQQVAVIKKMVNDLCMPIEVVTVPTARAEDGLALSSRNGYLSDEERQLATGLYKTLNEIAEALNHGEQLDKTLAQASLRLEERGFRPDYVEVRAAADLSPAAPGVSEVVILGAAFLGNARLIDNLVVTLNRGIV
ncbi:MAG: pantoate--beta-alanine ligase [Thalassolituus sp.]|nr:MAG: pantoate--beta-alanine ligase [Thalassolituus sp.]